jgi:hypothetical protein
VQDGPPLGDVDLLAAEHGVDPVAQARLLGQPAQQRERLVGDAVLRVVEEEAGGLGREALAPRRVLGEEPAEMQVADVLVVRLERLPGRAASQWCRAHGRVTSPSLRKPDRVPRGVRDPWHPVVIPPSR